MAYIPIELRKRIYERDKYTCQYCGKIGQPIRRYGRPCIIENPKNVNTKTEHGSYNGLDVIPFEIDHIIPVCYGGDTVEENLVLACAKCNRSKGYRLLGVKYGRVLA
jgi:5-methylcytosine-specific restriction endonuclease McrA